MKFENINENIVKALNEQGITEQTRIQEKAIPLIKKGFDVIGISKTGSGKTIAFALPILENVLPKKGLQALVLSPTRELAIQISKEFSKFGKYMNLNVATVYGGVGYDRQINAMSRAEIVVGTTGRLCDHLRQNLLDLSKLNCIVIDEADKMVEMGFIQDIRAILDNAPGKRQILLFGATISSEIDQLKKRYMKEPKTAKDDLYVKEEYLEQYYYNVEQHKKFSLLVHLLKNEKIKRAIIFCSTRSTCELIHKNLAKQNIEAEMTHGKLTQHKRQRVMERFNSGRTQMLVASAVAARGLDIKEVTHIFNYDLANDPQEYIHRIGRTARAGETGKAITLLSPRDHDTFRTILDRSPVNVEEIPKFEFPNIRFETGFRRPRNNFHGGNNNFGRRNNSFGRRNNSNFGRRRNY